MLLKRTTLQQSQPTEKRTSKSSFMLEGSNARQKGASKNVWKSWGLIGSAAVCWSGAVLANPNYLFCPAVLIDRLIFPPAEISRFLFFQQLSSGPVSGGARGPRFITSRISALRRSWWGRVRTIQSHSGANIPRSPARQSDRCLPRRKLLPFRQKRPNRFQNSTPFVCLRLPVF